MSKSKPHTITEENDSTAEIGNKLVGGLIGVAASGLGIIPSKLTKIIGEVEILDLLEEHDKALHRQHERDIQAFEEIIGKNESEKHKVWDGAHHRSGAETRNIQARNNLRAELRQKLDKLK